MAPRHHDPRAAMGKLAKGCMAVGGLLLIAATLLIGIAAYRVFVLDQM